MTFDRDIYTAANELIKQHGLKGASKYAANRIVTSDELKDHHGANIWRKIRAALVDLSDISFKNEPIN